MSKKHTLLAAAALSITCRPATPDAPRADEALDGGGPADVRTGSSPPLSPPSGQGGTGGTSDASGSAGPEASPRDAAGGPPGPRDGRTADGATMTPPPAPLPPLPPLPPLRVVPAPPQDPCGYPSARRVVVTNVATLRAALAAAMPGDLIQLTPGTYAGRFELTASGAMGRPIVICGPRQAILDAGGGGYALHLEGASQVVVSGITATNGLKNIMLDAANDNTLSNIEVSGSLQEGVHFRRGSSRNILVGSFIHDTGLRDPQFGEGVYIGSSGGDDPSDQNQVVDNRITGSRAECIDVKEGTRSGLISGNFFDGAAQVGANFADSLIDVKGRDYLVEKNMGGNALLNAFEVHSIGGAVDSGHENVFRENVLSVKAAAGLGIWLDVKARANVVSCSNMVTGAPD